MSAAPSLMENQAAPALIAQTGDSLREAFGKALSGLADEFKTVVVLDADIAGGTGVPPFRTRHPDRFLQFGIAEQNMMAAAGGLAATGLIPIVTTFAVFCLRAVEQARLSLAYAGRNAKIVASHPGLDVGPDGGSAQALEDMAAFRAIPGMTVISPADPIEMKLATRAMLEFKGPVYMRTGRSPAKRVFGDDHTFEIGKGKIVRDGKDVTIVACGVEVARAVEAAELLAAEGIEVRVVNMATIKPIDKQLLIRCAKHTGCFVTAEDHNIYGGLGSAVAELFADRLAQAPRLLRLGLPDRFPEKYGSQDDLLRHFGLTPEQIAERAASLGMRSAA